MGLMSPDLFSYIDNRWSIGYIFGCQLGYFGLIGNALNGFKTDK